MDPEQAALAAELLRAQRLIPIHDDGYDTPGLYEPVHDALARLGAATDRAAPMTPGETTDV
jgi:L-ascorbate metabolism protein UlaG (beta-lactamase superfamily)